MNVTIEFTGAARSLVGHKTVPLDLNRGATYQDIVRALARRYPCLIGVLIDTDGETFLSSNMLVINGQLETPAMVMNDCPRDGEYLILMSLITGGD